EGVLRKRRRIQRIRNGRTHEVIESGQFRAAAVACEGLRAGQVGYFTANSKELRAVHIGDTVTEAARPAAQALPGYVLPKPMVFSGLYPIMNNDFEALREALNKLSLNDSSFTFHPETSEGLGL